MDASGSSTPSTPSTNTPLTDSSTQNSSPKRSSKRGKSYPAWAHCRLIESTTSKGKLMCMYCQKVFAGGGINRFKQHLAGIRGEVEACKKVLPDVRYQMQKSIDEHVEKRKKTQESFEEEHLYGPNMRGYDQEHLHMEDDYIQQIPSPFSAPPMSKGKGSSARGYQDKRSVEIEKNQHTVSGLIDVIERYSHGDSDLRSRLTSEIKIFRTAQGDFGRKSAIADRDAMLPEDLNLGDILADDDDDANDVEIGIGDRNQSYMDTPSIRSQNLDDELSPRSNAHGIGTNLSPWPPVNFD
ncbi:putative Zinc finger, BED-type [Corchorus olitorius]|uniref:Zinc finger, BED-type n=1 Tax=Corchorus olitorius TaxID=93759 RepID=A0A1R3K9Z7_9ROSI|nr:putative Zinc finger, BED-type [Corchorus olitorius]